MPLQASEVLQPYFKASKGNSRTSLRCGVLTRFAVKIFFLRFAQLKKAKDSYWQATYEGNFSCVLNQEFLFFGSWVAVFTSNPSCLKYWLLHFLFYKEAMCKGSSGKGLLYAVKAVQWKDYFMHLILTIVIKGCWVISPNYRVSHPWCFCAVGDVVAQRYDVLCDWLQDACHMAGVCWRSHCKGFRSKESPHYCFEQSTRKLS